MKKALFLFAVPVSLVILVSAADASTVDVVTGVDSATGRRLADRARDYLGVAYVYAGASSSGVDCSGLVYCVYRDVLGVGLPRGVPRLMEAGRAVAGDATPGDLLFFDTTGGPSHVGLYLGSGRFAHAASEGPRTGVIISSLTERYYRTRYLGARRYVEGVPRALRIGLDDRTASRLVDQPLLAGLPVCFSVNNGLSRTTWLTLRFFQDGEFVLSKRIRSTPGEPASEVWLVPGRGSWTVTVSDGGVEDRLELRFTASRP